MSRRPQEHVRRVLPLGSRARRVLDLDAGEGPSAQPDQPRDLPRVRDGQSQTQESASGVIQTTPMKHKGILRGIRRRMGGLKPLEIDEYLLELDRDPRRRRMVADDSGWPSSGDDDDNDDDDDNGDDDDDDDDDSVRGEMVTAPNGVW